MAPFYPFMDNVDVWDAKEVVFGVDEQSWTELPPIPEWFNERLLEIGGTCDDTPNLRVVSGLDPEVKEFYGGRWWMKYAFKDETINSYTVWHKPDGSKRILSNKEAEVLGKSKKKYQGILIPVVDRQVIEYGIPRYFLEFYKPPEMFGSAEAWESIRYDFDDAGKSVDLMGEFPHNGMYTTWFCIEEPVVENGKIVSTKFRELDEVVLAFIEDKVKEVRNTYSFEQHKKLRKEVDADYVKQQADIEDKIRDIVTERVDKLMN